MIGEWLGDVRVNNIFFFLSRYRQYPHWPSKPEGSTSDQWVTTIYWKNLKTKSLTKTTILKSTINPCKINKYLLLKQLMAIDTVIQLSKGMQRQSNPQYTNE